MVDSESIKRNAPEREILLRPRIILLFPANRSLGDAVLAQVGWGLQCG